MMATEDYRELGAGRDPWRARVAVKEMAGLEHGWDSYDAEPPNSWSRLHALRVIDVMARMDFEPVSIAPSVEGGVTISFLTGPAMAAIEALNTGVMIAVTSEPDMPPATWKVATNERAVHSTLERIQRWLEERQYAE